MQFPSCYELITRGALEGNPNYDFLVFCACTQPQYAVSYMSIKHYFQATNLYAMFQVNAF